MIIQCVTDLYINWTLNNAARNICAQTHVSSSVLYSHLMFLPSSLPQCLATACFLAVLFLYFSFHHFIIVSVTKDLFPFHPPLITLLCAHSHYLPFFSPAFSPNLLFQHLHLSLSAYLSPITAPLPHSIFVLVQLQKWVLAVTNLLAKPPRAPCGGASSQRTHVIDWTWGKLCQAGHHDWISCLIINSLLPQVLWGDTSVTWHIFMTHDALDFYGDPHCQILLSLAHTVSLLWLDMPDTQLVNAFVLRAVCHCNYRIHTMLKVWKTFKFLKEFIQTPLKILFFSIFWC